MWLPRENDTLKETSIEGELAEHGDVAGSSPPVTASRVAITSAQVYRRHAQEKKTSLILLPAMKGALMELDMW